LREEAEVLMFLLIRENGKLANLFDVFLEGIKSPLLCHSSRKSSGHIRASPIIVVVICHFSS
jgi:hypothetical protein